MARINDVLGYLCRNYPYKSELSKARLTKMVYLADWKHVLTHHRQLTDISWFFNHYGPYVDDIYSTAIFDSRFNVQSDMTYYGTEKEVISIKDDAKFDELTLDEVKVLDFIIEATSSLNWQQFINLVYSTYPIMAGNKYEPLNLIKFAQEYTN